MQDNAQDNTQDNAQATPQATPLATPQATPQANVGILLEYCLVPRTREEMMGRLQLTDRKSFKQIYIDPLLASHTLTMTVPDKPSSPLQKYLTIRIPELDGNENP